jgi:hypothetical protein
MHLRMTFRLKYIELHSWSNQCRANLDNWKEYSVRLDQVHSLPSLTCADFYFQIDKDVARTDRDEREEFKDDNSPYLAQIKEILRNHLWLNWNIGIHSFGQCNRILIVRLPPRNERFIGPNYHFDGK